MMKLWIATQRASSARVCRDRDLVAARNKNVPPNGLMMENNAGKESKKNPNVAD
jgi:hypothetical protein